MRKTLVTLSIATAVLLAPAAAAQAGTGPNVTCPKGSVTGTMPTALGVFQSSSSAGPCTVQLSSWSVPDTYDGKGYGPSAKPQVLFDRVTATLTGQTSTVAVKLPASRWCQIDYRAANGTYLYGRIVECHPTAVVHGKPPVVSPPAHHAHHHKPHARVRVVAPTDLPKTLAFTASPFDLSKYVEGAAAALLLGVAFVLAAGFKQSGPKHKSLR